MRKAIFLVLLSVATPVLAYQSCDTAETALQLVELSGDKEKHDNLKPLRQLIRLICRSGAGFPLYYRNGRLAAIGENFTWHYPNGQVATQVAGNGNVAFYYPNGKTFSILPGNRLVAWTYPNGKTFSALPGNTLLPWMWPNGRVMAQLPSQPHFPWYDAEGRVAFPKAPTKVNDEEMAESPWEVLRDVVEAFKELED